VDKYIERFFDLLTGTFTKARKVCFFLAQFHALFFVALFERFFFYDNRQASIAAYSFLVKINGMNSFASGKHK